MQGTARVMVAHQATNDKSLGKASKTSLLPYSSVTQTQEELAEELTHIQWWNHGPYIPNSPGHARHPWPAALWAAKPGRQAGLPSRADIHVPEAFTSCLHICCYSAITDFPYPLRLSHIIMSVKCYISPPN